MGAMPINVLHLGSQQRGKRAHGKGEVAEKGGSRCDSDLGEVEPSIDKTNFIRVGKARSQTTKRSCRWKHVEKHCKKWHWTGVICIL